MAKYNPDYFKDDEVKREFEELSDVLQHPTVEAVFFAQLNAEPAKYSDGMVVYADGTNWNPGSGEGLYMRYNSTWNYLG